MSRIFFKSLTQAAGRKPMPHIPVKYLPHYSLRAKAPFIGELAAKGGLRG